MKGKKRAKYKPKKSKGVAIALAVLFGIFSYLYTWKTDAWKFFVALIFGILLSWTLIVPFLIWIAVIVDQAVKPEEYFEDYYEF